jgi:hypothetical protein
MSCCCGGNGSGPGGPGGPGGPPSQTPPIFARGASQGGPIVGLLHSQTCGCTLPPLHPPCVGPPPCCPCCQAATVFTVCDECGCDCRHQCEGSDSDECDCCKCECCCDGPPPPPPPPPIPGGPPGSPPGGPPPGGPPTQALRQAVGVIDHALSRLTPNLPGTQTGPAVVSLPRGNVIVRLRPVGSGPFDPRPLLTYNSRAGSQSIQFGHGWSDRFNPVVVSRSSTAVDLVDGVGAVQRYTDKDGSGRCNPPRNSCAENG